MKKLLLMLLGCIVATSVFADLNNEIDRLINHRMPNAHVGIVVRDLKNDHTLYQKNPYQAFSPASNLKLFTSAASLFSLGPRYHFKTKVLIDKSNRYRKKIKGSLVFHFGGDPSLCVKNLQYLVKRIHDYGIRQIEGDIVLDTSFFTGSDYAPGWVQDSLNWSYSAPVNAIMLDYNLMKLELMPNEQLGQPAMIRPMTDAVVYKGVVKTVSKDEAEHHCSLSISVDAKNQVTFSGCWPQTGRPHVLKLAVRNPLYLAKQVIRDALEKYDITLTGHIRQGEGKTQTLVIAEHHSAPLSVLVQGMLTYSNNLYAEAMLKTLGHYHMQRGSFQEGVNSMQAILHQRANIDFSQAEFFDGSGLSRYNLVTPHQLAQLLYVMYHSGGIKKYFIKGLPKGGVSGTLSHRMQVFNLINQVNAKTGSMRHVSSLSGYLKARNKHWLTFVIFMDHAVMSTHELREIQNQLVDILCRAAID